MVFRFIALAVALSAADVYTVGALPIHADLIASAGGVMINRRVTF